MDGIHAVANFYRCRGEARYLTDAALLRQFCLNSINESGLTPLGELFHKFDGGGVTGTVVLAESHLAIHTWPELNSVALDVYVCNFTQDNSAKARQVVDHLAGLFAPEDFVRHEVPRDRQYLYEFLNDDYGFFIRSSARLEGHTACKPSRYGELQFGRLLRLDGCFMTSEHEEFFYHENLIHIALTAHEDPRKVLIIGGGDGGAAEEALKHPSVERVTVVELDGKVVDIAKQFVGNIHHGVFEHPRLRLLIADGLKFIAETNERFDHIALDLPDPIGPAAKLYEEAFFRDCKRALAPGGVLTLHMGSPVPNQIVKARRLGNVFGMVRIT